MVEPASEDVPDTQLGALVESFIQARQRGERPSVEEYAARNPAGSDRLRRLLSQIDSLEGIKDGWTHSLPGKMHQAASELAVPPTLGSYRLLGILGRGGMGVVHEAEHVTLGRKVALKVFSSSLGLDPRRVERFRREAHAAAVIDHPNIVPVHEVGEVGGFHYYAMKLVRGQSLDRVIEDLKGLLVSPNGGGIRPAGTAGSCPVAPSSSAWRLLSESSDAWTPLSGQAGPAGVPELDGAAGGSNTAPGRRLDTPSVSSTYYLNVARLGLQVAEALSCAHNHGILHRDIKPSNLILDESGKIWVADFGLAKVDRLEDVTRTGEVAGTFRYMAPERFRGRSLPQSDIYGLGVTLYELLTLRSPFAAPARDDLLRSILDEEPPPPTQVDPGIPGELGAIVMHAMAKDAGARHASAEALALDLRRFLAGKPARSRWAAAAGPPVQFCRRRPGVAILLLACALALLGAGWALFRQDEPAAATSSAVPVAPVASPLAERFEPAMLLELNSEARGPMDLEVFDLDGDKVPEIVTENVHSKNLNLFRGASGGGSFTDAGVLSVGDVPLVLLSVDLDRDGLRELAAGNRRSRDISVLRNLGNLRFEPAVNYALGFEPFGLVAVDVEHDGDLDLVAIGPPGSLRLLRNSGGGKLALEETVRVPGLPSGLAAADVNGDSWSDLVAVDTSRNEVRILDGSAAGFSPRKENLAVGQGACACAALDLDGDGWVDIAVSNYLAGTVSILRNTKDGRFAPAEHLKAGGGAFWVAGGDLDGDARPDLAVACEKDAAVALLRNTGKILAAPELLAVQGPTNRVRMADLDGDGDLDLVATAGRVAVLKNRGNQPRGTDRPAKEGGEAEKEAR